MNTKTRSTFITLAAIAALASAAGTADASPPRGPETAPHDRVLTGAFAERLEALGGSTLAQYLAEHMERRLG